MLTAICFNPLLSGRFFTILMDATLTHGDNASDGYRLPGRVPKCRNGRQMPVLIFFY